MQRCVAPHHSVVCGATPFCGVWRHIILRCVAPHHLTVCGATSFSSVWRHIIQRCVAPHHSAMCGATIWLCSCSQQHCSQCQAVWLCVSLSDCPVEELHPNPNVPLSPTFIGPCIVMYFYSKTNKMHQFLKFILFCSSTLHVSDRLSVHHQESKTVHTASDICQTDSVECLLAGTR
jgi:hypothetical protein